MPSLPVGCSSIYVEESGRGQPLIFLSGLGGDSRAFSLAQRHFSKWFRTIAIDNRDVGRSGRALKPYSTLSMAKDVEAVMDWMKIDAAHIVGHSLGGMIAQEIAINQPERVRSLVLASTHCGAEPWRHALLESWILQRNRMTPAEFSSVTLPWLVSPGFYQQGSAQIDGLIRFAERNTWPQEADAFERQARAAMGHYSRDRLSLISTPTLVLVGQDDLVNPPRIARELSDTIVDAQFVEIPGVGHLPHVEDNPSFRHALDLFYNKLGLIPLG